jgi:PAS domain S-box-containing protein
VTRGSLTDALRETLAVFDSTRPLTTSEVADALDVGRRSTYNRLDKLVDRGRLETKEVGARGRVWWQTGGEGVDESGDGTDGEPADGTDDGTATTSDQFASLVEAVEEYAIFMLDTHGRISTWNPGAERIKGYERDEIVGEHFSTFYTEDAIAERVPEQNLAKAAAEGSVEDHGWRVRKDGSRFWANVTITALYDDGELEGYAKVTRDMSDRRRFEQRLRRQRDALESELDEVFQRVDDAFFALDDWRFTYVTDRTAELFERSVDDLDGALLGEALPEFADGKPRRLVEEAVETQESVEFDFYAERLDTWLEARAYPSETGLSVYVRDITSRKTHEQQLRAQFRQQQAISELGRTALETDDLDALMAEASERVAEVLGNDYCKVLDLDADAEELLLRQGVGWKDGIVGEATISSVEADSQAAYTLSSSDPVVVTDLETEYRFSGLDLLRNHDVHSGISVVIGSPDDPWGILGTHDTDRREFSDHDVNFVQSVANILATAINRHADERELRRTQEQLEALNSLNVVARDITDTVIEQSTREQIEQTVCEHLAETDSYEFAWIGDVDMVSEEVRLRAEAGVEGYLEETTISVDPDDPKGRGPTGRAVQSKEMQIVEDTLADPEYEEWRDHAREYGFVTSAAIPVVYENTIYGVLNVYSSRHDAFTGREGDVIDQLGEVVGHAIAAVERKRALMSDEVVELAFRIPDTLETLDIDGPTGGRVTFTNTIPTSGDEYLVYGTANEAGVDVLETMVAANPLWGGLLLLGETDDHVRFQMRVSESTVLSMVASQGGSIEEAVLEDGDFHLRLHLVPGSQVRQIIETIQSENPSAEMLSRRQITRSEGASDPVSQSVEGELTERQYTTLEAAYNGGFFEWPRVNSGKEIAEAMDVAPPTFHQHLRKAEQKVLSSLLARSLD